MSSPTTRLRTLAAHNRQSGLFWIQLTLLVGLVALFFLPALRRVIAHAPNTANATNTRVETLNLARLSESVSVRAAGQGNPTINLSDGREILTSYAGPAELRQALEQNKAEALGLAAADFDEDGVPDLVSGYSYNGRGIVTVLRGNVDSIYPSAPEAKRRQANRTFTSAPFLSPGQVFDLPVAAEFIGAGDFDSDGHWDIVSASRIGKALYLLSGDGHGGFAQAQEISLPGVVTAMTTGEVNRRDGLTDVVVGIWNEAQSEVMVFEGPKGALKAEPERFNMPAEVGSLALGELDDRYPNDLAVTAGNELIILAGRDRKLSLDEKRQAAVSPALRTQRVFASRIRSMTIGDFTGSGRTDVALLMDNGDLQLLSQREVSAKRVARETIETWTASSAPFAVSSQANLLISTHTSGSPHDDLLIADGANGQLHVLTSDGSEGGPGTAAARERKQVTAAPLHLTTSLDITGAPVAVLPLRLNVDALGDLVILRAKQTAASIIPTTAATIFTVNSNADTNDGVCNAANCTLREAINAANANAGADTINFSIGSGPQTIIPLTVLPTITDPVTIDGVTQPGFGGTPIIELNGSSVSAGTVGLLITGGSTTVRGLVINRFFNGRALRFESNGGNLVEGNFIGTDFSGNAVPGDPNLANGTGVFINGPPNNTIGGTTNAARNLISGNFEGINISGVSGIDTTGNLVQGNRIGTNFAGTAGLGNASTGVFLFRAVTIVGGTVAGAGNMISSNGTSGIVFNSSSGTLVQGNLIGTDVNGNVDLGNSAMGVQVPAGNPSNTIGGTTPAARNIVSGNNIFGFQIRGAATVQTLVQGNFIGTNAQGTAAIGNTLDGISIESSNNTIGGETAARNIISGNGRDGVSIFTNTGITVQNNFIGTDVTGNNCLGNGRDGIFVNNGSVGHTIADNLITCNGRNGVNIPNVPTNDPGIRIFLDNNFVFANGLLGIDLGDPGITPNDPLDADGGANLQQNFPVLTSFAPIAPGDGSPPRKPNSPDVSITVNATLNSTPNTTFTVHWYFSTDSQCSTNQQGSRPLAFSRIPGVTTDNNGNAAFIIPFTFPVGTTSGIINCTATDPQGNTSEFSSCLPVNDMPPTMRFSAASYNVNEGGVSATVSVIRDGDTSTASTVDFAASDSTATQNQDYVVTSGTLNFAAGETSKIFTVLIVDDAFVEPNEAINLTLSNATGVALGTPSTATTTITDNDTASSTSPSPKRFAAMLDGAQETPANNSTAKGTGFVLLNQGETSALVGLQFQNLGSAQISAHIHGSGATGVMAPILFTLPTTNPVTNHPISPTAQQVTDLKAGLHYFNVHSTNFVNGEIRGQLLWNPTLDENFFVRQQYLDFLSRDGDPGGFNFWVNQVGSCQADPQCLHDRTITTSNAFFFEPEFQQTAGYVFRVYRAAFGNNQPFPNPDSSNATEANKLIEYSAFVADRARVVGGANLAAAQQAFANQFVLRSAFVTKYAAATTGAQFVDAILANIQSADNVNLTGQRQALIDQFNSAGGGNAGRAMVLYRLADDNAQSPINNQAFINAEYNRQFALTLFFGYLRRNPDIGGFLFWQSQINLAPVRDVPKQNALVCSFITAAEYQFRFSPNAPRSNAECPQ